MTEIILTISRVLNYYFASMDASSATELEIAVDKAVPKACGLHLELQHGCFFSEGR